MAFVTDSFLLDVVILLCVLLSLVYLYFKYQFSYWKRRGFPYLKPTVFFGNFREILLQKTSVGQHFRNLYNEGKGKPFVGFYILGKPCLLIRDPEFVKLVLVKDFNIFYNRYVYSNEKTDPLGTQNLFMLRGAPWKYLRTKLNPAFTTFRMKQLFPLVETCGLQVANYLETVPDLREPVEVKELMGKYGTDVISTCSFGIASNSLIDPNAEFREFGRKIFEPSAFRSFEFMSMFLLPHISKCVNLKFFSSETTKFMRRAFWETINQREEKQIHRDDFLELLIQLKNKGRVDDNKNDTEIDRTNEFSDQKNLFEFNGDNLVAQAAIFFTAGFEAIATNSTFTLYEMALRQDVQEKVRAEIRDVLQKEKGKLSYEAINQMEYLHMVVSETLRKYPNLPILDRVANTDYVFPGTNVTVKKGTPVFIPLMGLQMDPEVYPDPERFEPERFSQENINKRNPYMYMPFGDGPKFCIGMRFGLVAVKIGLVNILSNYEVSPCDKTPIPLILDPKALILSSESGMPLSFTKLKK